MITMDNDQPFQTPGRVERYFHGRQDALSEYYSCFPNKHMRNGIYYSGSGGFGKTWILWKILDENRDFPGREIPAIIDFFDTANQSLRGLQENIKKRLDNDGITFKYYDEQVAELEKIRRGPHDPGTLASLERRLNAIFIECAKKAIAGRELALLFDTFERVHHREVGEWLMENFLDSVKGLKDLVVVIAGRPSTSPLPMPQGIGEFPLSGLKKEETFDLIHHFWQDAPTDSMESIYRATEGSPLIVRLILELNVLQARKTFVEKLGQLDLKDKLTENPDLMYLLLKEYSYINDRNVALWSMAYLKRRFNRELLVEVAKSESEILVEPTFEGLYRRLTSLSFIKEPSEPGAHMLHDQMRELLTQFCPGDVEYHKRLRSRLLDLVITDYYPKKIQEDQDALEKLRQAAGSWLEQIKVENRIRQLRVEQFGYRLDRDLKDGLSVYVDFRREITSTFDYDFEELLWGELRDCLPVKHPKAFEHYCVRGQWLREQGLFRKAEHHFEEMVNLFPPKQVGMARHLEIWKYLGFMQMRQGRLLEAEKTYHKLDELIPRDDPLQSGELHNLWGQLDFEQGRWSDALEHHAQCFTTAIEAHSLSLLISTNLNRANLFSHIGDYKSAERECEEALDRLGKLPKKKQKERENLNRRVVALTYMGMSYRHNQDFEHALDFYKMALKESDAYQNHEMKCNVLGHLGITHHLIGRKFRRQQTNWIEAVRQQRQAWQYLTDAIIMAYRIGWDPALADGLNRLAKVYREIYRLDIFAPTEAESAQFFSELQSLQNDARQFTAPIEVELRPRLLQLKEYPDEKRGWLVRAAHLFDLGVWVAIESRQYHRALESLTELARVIIELHEYSLLPNVLIRIGMFREFSYESQLFEILSLLAQGDEHFEKDEWDDALKIYAQAYRHLADETGYARYQLEDRLRDLEWRLDKLPKDIRLVWCGELEAVWKPCLRAHPEMRQLLEITRLHAHGMS